MILPMSLDIMKVKLLGIVSCNVPFLCGFCQEENKRGKKNYNIDELVII